MGWSYRDLEVWQKGTDLVVEVYKLSQLLPRDEQFGLTTQIRRAAVSIPANIAEGQGRMTDGDFQRFLRIARGSLAEVETHLIIAVKLGYVEREQAKPAWHSLNEVGRLLTALIRSVEKGIEVKKTNGRIAEFGTPYEPEEELYDLPDPEK